MAVIPDQGKQWVIDMIQAVAPASNATMNALNWGTGATAEGAGNTVASMTEASEARVTGTLSQPTATTDRLVATQTCAGAGKTITQVMRVNTTTKGGTGETMYFYALFTGLPLSIGDAIQFTCDGLVS